MVKIRHQLVYKQNRLPKFTIYGEFFALIPLCSILIQQLLDKSEFEGVMMGEFCER